MTGELTLRASRDNTQAAVEFVAGLMRKQRFSEKQVTQVSLAVEEAFVNIASYAYAPGVGDARIRVEAGADRVTVELSDSGTPYDPFGREDPDVTLSAEERVIGGLGIYMVKKLADEVEYRFAGGKNILQIVKYK